MDNLICTECGTTYYSAAADSMVDRGQLCDCGGRLRVVDDDDPVPAVVALPDCSAGAPLLPFVRPVRRFATAD
jgi:hypothetical protein